MIRTMKATLLLLSASVTFAPTPAEAQAVSGGTALEQYQNDLSCAAAADAWLIGMPNGTPTKEQDETWAVLVFFARQAQTSGQAAGHPPADAAGAFQIFVADLLPHLKSSDPATAERARTEAAAGTHHCAGLAAFQNSKANGQQ